METCGIRNTNNIARSANKVYNRWNSPKQSKGIFEVNICTECGLNVTLGFHMIGCSHYDEEKFETARKGIGSNLNASALQHSVAERTKTALKTYIKASTKSMSDKLGLWYTDDYMDSLVDEVIDNPAIDSAVNVSFMTTIQILQEQGLLDEESFSRFLMPNSEDDI